MLSQVRRSVRGSWARYFQKLLTSGTPRVALMSSKTARTSGLASAYSIGCIGLSPPGLGQARKIGATVRRRLQIIGTAPARLSYSTAAMTETTDARRDFFLSFNRAEQAWADWIAWTLEEAGYSVWYQRWDFAGNFVRDVDRAHDGSRRTLGVLSPDSLASANVRNEWDARRAEDPGNEHDRLLLIRVRACDPPGLLKPFVWLDVADLPEAKAKKVILARVSGLRRKPAGPPLFPGKPKH